MYLEDDEKIPEVTIKGGFQDVDIKPPEDFKNFLQYELMGGPIEDFMQETFNSMMNELGEALGIVEKDEDIKNENGNPITKEDIEKVTTAMMFKTISSLENPIISSYKAYTDEEFSRDFKKYVKLIKDILSGVIPEEYPRFLSSFSFSTRLELKIRHKEINAEEIFPERDDVSSRSCFCFPYMFFHDIIGYANISMNWIKILKDEIIKDSACIEVIAGSSAFSYALKSVGTNILATTDDYSWIEAGDDMKSFYLEKSKEEENEDLSKYLYYKAENIDDIQGHPLQGSKWKDIPYSKDVVKEDALTTIRKYINKCDFLLISWPPMDESCHVFYQMMKDLNPKCKMIYIGEDEGGCCASDSFFENAEYNHSYDDILDVINRKHLQFSGYHDEIMIFG